MNTDNLANPTIVVDGITYSQFVQDVATAILSALKEPEYISQNEAFRRYGRRSVERWRASGDIIPITSKGKREYKLAELKRLKARTQDYLYR